jgi:hypothetical protein
MIFVLYLLFGIFFIGYFLVFVGLSGNVNILMMVICMIFGRVEKEGVFSFI